MAITITDRVEKDVVSLLGAGRSALTALASEAEKSSSRPLSIEALREFVAAFVDDSEVSGVARALVAMRRGCENRNESPEEFVSALDAGLQRKEWSKEQFSSWNEVKDVLVRLLHSHALTIATKASELYHLHNRHLHEVKIVTEARPIFDSDGGKILNYIVHNDIHLLFSDQGENESYVQIALELGELELLRDLADRAIRKTELLRRELKKVVGTEPRVFE